MAIEVGKSYHTREKNTVAIVRKEEQPNNDGVPTMYYWGTFTAVRTGSENLMEPPNNVAKFLESGAWIARFGQEQPDHSCHDLTEECHA